jgi:hypothetical protein
MSDEKANLKFWGILALAALSLVAVAAGTAAAGSCRSGFAFAEVKKGTAAGCIDFWVNRYQSLATGLVSTAVAGVAAYFVLKQLWRMAENNALAASALRVAEAQRLAAEKANLAAACDSAFRLYGAVMAMAYHLAGSLKGAEVGNLRSEYVKQIQDVSPLVTELRRTVPHNLVTAEEKALYKEFGERFGSINSFLIMEATRGLGLDVPTIEDRPRFSSSTPGEAVTHVLLSGVALFHLGRRLESRLGM